MARAISSGIKGGLLRFESAENPSKMTSGGASLDILTNAYKQVIDDVVRNMKEEYLNEGADTEMLEELKTLWLTKLNQSGAVNRPARAEPPPRPSPSHSHVPELHNIASVVSQPPSGPVPSPAVAAPSKTMTGASPSPSMMSSSGGVVSGSSHHQQRAGASGSIGKTLSQSSPRPPPALLHIPETSSATPPQARVQADSSATSSVIQQAPPRSQQTTPSSTIAESASTATAATAQQLVTTPIATPSVMLHPNILALQQQVANQAASSNQGAAVPTAPAAILPSSAPSVVEALQQQLGLGGGALGGAVSGATVAPAVNPFGAALNLMNPAAGGVVPVQTPQGTVLLPLQAYLALQLKQQQLAAAVAASAASGGGETSSSDEASTSGGGGGGSKEVHQIDGLPPVLKVVQGSNRRAMENLDISSVVSKEREQGMVSSFLEPQMSIPVVRSKCKASSDRSRCESEATNLLPNLTKSKSQSHKKKKSRSGKAVIVPNAEVIVQLDGPMGGGGQGSKVIVQLDGNGSSSEEDSDGDEDSSEDEDEAAGVTTGAAQENDEEPLNSDDDIDDGDSDEEGGGDFETEDTIVCQWEKVYRVKNKWKFQLKDGVMHIGGCDYVFHKTNGEADW